MNKSDSYRWTIGRIKKKVKDHINTIATLANTAAILKEGFENYFWVGFYFFRGNYLLLGPFQGPPACVKLLLDNGVCSDCANERKTIIVDDVHEYPGHVACDSRSNSEIVVPIYNHKKKLMAVLDIDSINFSDFDETDRENLLVIADLLKNIWDQQDS